MENKFYRIQAGAQKWLRQVRHLLQRPYFPLAIVLFFLITVLVAVLHPGYTHTANNDLPASPGGNFSPAGGDTFLPVEQNSGTPSATLQDKPALPSSVKPPPSTQPVGKGEYDYSKPVPAADADVPEDYFRDAVFIGDSRTEGFQIFGGPEEATYYTARGLKVDTIFTKEVVEIDGGKKTTIFEALKQIPFRRVYIMLGINELGWAYSDLFIKQYGEVVAEIQNIAPQAQIYIQSLLPVSKERSLNDATYNNANIKKYNELIQQMAAEKKLYYLDVAQCVADPEGNLASGASTDGVHLQKTYCNLWWEYLRQHYISP